MISIRSIKLTETGEEFKEFLAIGYIGCDPKLKKIKKVGMDVACLDLLFFVNYPKMDNNCFKLVAWGDTATSLSRKIKKGTKTYIQGRIKKDYDKIVVFSYEVLESLEEVKARQEYNKERKKY